MFKIPKPSNSYFWLLILITLVLAGFGLVVIFEGYRQGWVQTIWHICQSGVQNLSQHLPATWQLVSLVIAAVVIIRGSWSIWQQVGSTRRFARLFWPFRGKLPARLQALLKTHHLSVESVVYINLAAPQAFCLGFWRPRIWLTAGLLNLLSDEELAAVLSHEAYHCRWRDQMRLLISRALQSAFFFLPLVGDLAKFAELQQEIAADRSAIGYLGDDLPLLCALQKLLTQQIKGVTLPGVAYSLFNVTEARLRRLIYPGQSIPFRWREALAGGVINLGVILLLGNIGLWAAQPVVEHNEVGACVIEAAPNT